MQLIVYTYQVIDVSRFLNKSRSLYKILACIYNLKVYLKLDKCCVDGSERVGVEV